MTRRLLFLTLAILTLPLVAAAQVVNLEPSRDCSKLSYPSSAIVTATRASGIVYLMTTESHCLQGGEQITVRGVKDKSFDGNFVVREITTMSSLTYVQAGPNVTSGGGKLAKRRHNLLVRALAKLRPKET